MHCSIKLSLWRNENLISTKCWICRGIVAPWLEVRECCPFYFLITPTFLVLSSLDFFFGLRQATEGTSHQLKAPEPFGLSPPRVRGQGTWQVPCFHWTFIPVPLATVSFGHSHSWLSLLLLSWLFILIFLPSLVSLRLLVFYRYQRPGRIFQIYTEDHRILAVTWKSSLSHSLGKY